MTCLAVTHAALATPPDGKVNNGAPHVNKLELQSDLHLANVPSANGLADNTRISFLHVMIAAYPLVRYLSPSFINYNVSHL